MTTVNITFFTFPISYKWNEHKRVDLCNCSYYKNKFCSFLIWVKIWFDIFVLKIFMPVISLIVNDFTNIIEKSYNLSSFIYRNSYMTLTYLIKRFKTYSNFNIILMQFLTLFLIQVLLFEWIHTFPNIIWA